MNALHGPAASLSGEPVQYCICRSTDISRFMIGCDACDEWYHGDCIGVSQMEAQYIRKYFCSFCRQKNPSLTIVRDYGQIGSRPCGMCANCNREYDCRRCEECSDMAKYGGPGVLGRGCRNRVCSNPLPGQAPPRRPQRPPVREDSSSGSEYEPPQPVRGASKRGRSRRDDRKRWRGSDRTWSDDSAGETEDAGPKQCFGPGCTNAARTGSKYCSDDCGLKLATNRIFEILPSKIAQWQATKCVAEERNKLALEDIRNEQNVSRKKLVDLDKKHKDLDVLIQNAKAATVVEDEDTEDEETEQTIFCVTCGHEINMRNAIKHMEKCFNRYESQSSFGSIYQTKIEGYALFCDHYNKHNKNYCKRLKVLCPEHTKEPRVPEDEVCGCPLVRELFIPTGEFCRQPKRKCSRHYMWEKLRRAEIDQERLRQDREPHKPVKVPPPKTGKRPVPNS